MYDHENERGSRCAHCSKHIYDRWQLEAGFCSKSCRKSYSSVDKRTVEREVRKLMEQYKRGGVHDPLVGYSQTRP